MLEPHPHFPYLAVSGLDNDIKLFMPVAEDYVDLEPKAKVLTIYTYINIRIWLILCVFRRILVYCVRLSCDLKDRRCYGLVPNCASALYY